jgi:hypothetical protein
MWEFADNPAPEGVFWHSPRAGIAVAQDSYYTSVPLHRVP